MSDTGLSRLWPGLVVLWCSWTHGGGYIMRDTSGRVNWQCKKCARWANAVSAEDEKTVIAASIAAKKEAG